MYNNNYIIIQSKNSAAYKSPCLSVSFCCIRKWPQA